jgi:hypothetical protein
MLTPNSLENTILPQISVDEFEPKLGDEYDAIVVAFYAKDEEPADDLCTFIQRGVIDIEDVEVSKSTDENGNYVIFVEIVRNKKFKERFMELIKDVEKVAGKQEWEVKPYLSDDTFQFDDPKLFNYIITDKKDYMDKEDFIKQNMKESIINFFANSNALLTIAENSIILMSPRFNIAARVIDSGIMNHVLVRNQLSESAFELMQIPLEVDRLSYVLGTDYSVAKINDYLMVEHKNKEVILLKNVEMVYNI